MLDRAFRSFEARDRMRDLGRDLAALRAAEPERAPWPAEWFSQSDSLDGRHCRALWRAVLHQCVVAALHRRERELSGRQGFSDHERSNGWVEYGWIGSRDFLMIADLADVDGTRLARGIHRSCGSPEGTRRLLAGMTGRIGRGVR